MNNDTWSYKVQKWSQIYFEKSLYFPIQLTYQLEIAFLKRKHLKQAQRNGESTTCYYHIRSLLMEAWRTIKITQKTIKWKRKYEKKEWYQETAALNVILELMRLRVELKILAIAIPLGSIHLRSKIDVRCPK